MPENVTVFWDITQKVFNGGILHTILFLYWTIFVVLYVKKKA
jgi:hypothetical protein